MEDIVRLINAYYANKDVLFNDLDALERLALDHTLHPYLYLVTNNKNYKKYNVGAIYTNEEFDKLRCEISNLLNENNIKHIFFKGIVIKEFYEEPYLRKMGDIDFIVEKNDYKKAIKLLSSNGFTFDDHMSEHHQAMYKNDIEIEVHQSLFDTNEPRYQYFLNIWDYSKNKSGFEYELDITYHYIYLICHLEYHILNGGAGLRPLIDLYLLKDKINRDEFNKYLNELNLTEFYSHLNSLMEHIFNDLVINDIDKEFLRFLINSGIHGNSINNNNQAVKYASKAKKGKLRYILKKLFPGVTAMKAYYPVLNKCVLLLPICYIRRFFYCIFKRGKDAKAILNVKEEEALIYQKMFKNIGL